MRKIGEALEDKQEAKKATFGDLYELLYVAAYGCNRRCEDTIRRAFLARKKDTPFLFFEYFLTHPLPKAEYIDSSKWDDDWRQRLYLVAPFAPRMAEHSVVVPLRKDGESTLAFRNNSALKDLQLVFRFDHSMLAREAWKDWSSLSVDIPPRPLEVSHQDLHDSVTGNKYRVGIVDGWSMDWQRESYNEGDLKNEPLSHANGRCLYDLMQPMFVGNLDKSVKGIFVPIASSSLYYGGIWAMFPGLADGDLFRADIGIQVARLAETVYLPVLTVLYEHWLERLHKDDLDGKGRPAPQYSKSHFVKGIELPGDLPAVYSRLKQPAPTAVFRNVFLQEHGFKHQNGHAGSEVADEIEKLMVVLWRRRDTTESWRKRDRFLESLIFEHYLIGSEVMAQLLCKVIVAARTLRKAGKTLPGCLVVGGAGSGKEDLARMLRLFSADPDPERGEEWGYFEGKEYVVNLASIRPAPLTAAVMGGVKLEGSPRIVLSGILEKIQNGRLERGRRNVPPPTLRMDEFNSMDPDSQGVLLRFLDNSEIVALGDVNDSTNRENEKVDCLVIGIMNEDPEDISREKAMEFFRKGEYLGKFIGDLMYEHFLGIRRLRPDVMYRMMRNGKFVIPTLCERRQDIPLLFRVYLNKELKALRSQSQEPLKTHISLDVLDRLVSEDLRWPGNVRQLQALAKVVSGRIFCEGPAAGCYVVGLSALDSGLQDVGLVASAGR